MSDNILSEPGTRPFPGSELALRVTGDPHPETFFQYGLRSVQDNITALAAIGRRFQDYEHILDFGCGCGRMLTWLEPLAEMGTKLYGTDTDADAIDWMREHLPYATVGVNDPLPPTAYEDGQFDLVFNHSVFTHLDEARQDAWLEELRRITRVGGHLLLTVHGEHAFAQYENAMFNNGGHASAARETYSGHGMVFMPDESWQEKGFEAWYGTAYHRTAYIFGNWSRWFRIKAYLPQGALNHQDIVVLERTLDGQHHGEYLRQPLSILWALHAEPPDDVPPAEAGNPRAQAALARAQGLIDRGPDLSSASRLGAPGNAWRRLLGGLMANFAAHERQIDEALVEAVRAQIEP